MREIHDHEVNDINKAIRVLASEQSSTQVREYNIQLDDKEDTGWLLRFHEGPGLDEDGGLNGLTQEALLAVVLDRLRVFQDGPFRCRENAIVITKLEECLMWLRARHEERARRGVAGKLEP